LNSVASALALPHWDPVPLSIVNNGHTIQVDDSAPSSLVLDGESYSLAQFHFHVPSEHTIEGRAFDAEIHLVHRTPGGRLAVIALFFQKGAANGPLRAVFDAIPMDPGSPRSIPGEKIDLGALLPRAPRFLSYEGSLTTPPCTEGVRWLVVLPDPAPLEVSEADLSKLRAAVHAPTNRPTQPRNDRAVELRAP
jgi:carbonic anhydrase